MRVGITGGIGSGKTTVCRIFESLGIPVFYADTEARKLYHNPDIQRRVVEVLGKESFVDGTPDFAYISRKIFSDEDLRLQVNGILHPEVKEVYRKWEEAYTGKVPYTLREAAILIESGAYQDCDKIIVVEAPEDIRLKRVIQRDGSDEQAVKARMKAQMTDEERRKFADFILLNDEKSSLIEQTLLIHRKLIAL